MIDFLEELNFDVDISFNGEDALNKSYENYYDLYLFDINVPKINGIELLKSLRENDIKTPTIFLTSYKDDDTLHKCFINGCDDFLRKPFKIDELLLRINAVLKRTGRILNEINLGEECHYDFYNRCVYLKEKKIHLHLKVIQLLEFFIENNNKIVSKKEIIDKLWSANENHSDGAVRLYISKIRKIIGKDKIISIKKVGYKISNIIFQNSVKLCKIP